MMNSLPQCGKLGFDPWVWKISWRREWQPTPVFLPGEFHGQRSLAGYSPWGDKELNTAEWLSLSLCNPKAHYLGIYAREIKLCQKKSSMQSSFIIVPNLKHSGCLVTSEQINKLWCIHTMDYNSLQHQRLWTTNTCNYMMSINCIVINVRN